MEQLIFRDRRGTDAFKWNGLSGYGFTRDDLMGMWVADMDFAAPAAVREELSARAGFGVFGYDGEPADYRPAFIDWMRRRHGVSIDPEWIRFSPGVVAAFNWMIQLFTRRGDAVIVQTPVYYPFSRAVEDNGRTLVTCELVNEGGRYRIDFDDFERKIVERKVKAFILCSPHNPVGRVWRREELTRMLAICRAHGVFVIADEIHQDFAYEPHRQIPAASLMEKGDRIVMLTAASKTFNLAGLQSSVVMIPDEEMRALYDHFTDLLHVGKGSSLSYAAVTAAYRGGEEWLEAVKAKVLENEAVLREVFVRKLPKAVISPLEGTYLAWVDLSAYVPQDQLASVMEDGARVAADYGVWFGGRSEGFIRLNLTTKTEYVREAAEAIAAAALKAQ